MKSKKMFIAIAAVLSVLAFALTRVIWPDPVGALQPEGGILAGFVLVNIFESLGFGIGLAFFITMWESMKTQPWVVLSITWLLINWWPHDSLHRVGENKGFAYLLCLELGFHVTLIIAGFILAQFAVKKINSGTVS